MSWRSERLRSNGYLNTWAASPDIFNRAVEANDFSENGGRRIIRQLILGDYPDDIHFPVEFTFDGGRKQRDVIEMQYLGGFLISERYKQIFESYHLSGWKTYDVVIRKRRSGEIISGYYGFSVTGRYPVAFPEPDATDVPDFFHPECWGLGLMCSSKVLDMLRENKIKDFELGHVNEKGEIDFDPPIKI